MSRKLVEEMSREFNWAFALLEKFVKTCPQDILYSKQGGFIVSQQVLHVLGVMNFLMLDKHEKPNGMEFSNDEVEMRIERTPSREQLVALYAIQKKRVRAYIATLDDSKLYEAHAGITHRRKKEISNFYVMLDLSAHLLYHLGTWDGVLRQHGQGGMWQ